MVSDSGGSFSQAVQQLQGSVQPLATLTGLPVETQIKRDVAVASLEAKIQAIIATQAAIGQFVTSVLPRLQRAAVDLNAGTRPDQVVAIVTQTTTSAGILKQRVDALSADGRAARDQLINFSASLASLEYQLENQRNSLNAELQDIARQLNEPGANRVASADTTALISRTGELMTPFRSVASQMASLATLKQSVNWTTDVISTVIDQITRLGNDVTVLAGDVSGVINELSDAPGAQLKAQLYLATAIRQLQTLQTDAA